MLSLYLDDVRSHMVRNNLPTLNLAEFTQQRPEIMTASMWLDVVRRATTVSPREAMKRNLRRTKLRFRVEGTPITQASTKPDLRRVWVERSDLKSGSAKSNSKRLGGN